MRITVAVTLALAGCAASGHHVADVVDVPTSASAAAVAPPPPPPRIDLEPSKAVTVEPRTVALAIAMGTLRAHPVGQKLGPLIAGLPQWRNVVQGVLTDPLQDLEWIYMAGPDFVHAAKSALLVRYTLADAVVDERIDALVQRSPSSAPFDLGVAGAKGTLASFGGDASRVVIRAQPSLVALVPEAFAKATATTLVHSRVLAPFAPPEALRATIKEPHHLMGSLPAAISDIRVRVVARDDGGAEISADGTCADAAAATAAADEVRALIQKNNGFIVRMMTHNLLGGVAVTGVGSQVELRATPTQDQLEATLRVIASFMGIDIGGPASKPAAP